MVMGVFETIRDPSYEFHGKIQQTISHHKEVLKIQGCEDCVACDIWGDAITAEPQAIEKDQHHISH